MNERRLKKLNFRAIVTSPLCSLIMAVLFGGIIIALMGFSALDAYSALLVGAFGSIDGIILTIAQSVPVLFTGLAYAFSAKAGLKNLGAEGQFLAGAMTAAIVGMYIPDMPAPLAIIITILMGALAGGIVAEITVLLKIIFHANELLISLMMNYVVNYFTLYLINYPFKGESSATPATNPVKDIVKLPALIERSQLNIGIFIGIGIAIYMVYYLYHTPKGFEVRCVGMNESVSRFKGMKVSQIMMKVMAASGAVAGIGGAVQVLGIYYNFMQDFSPGYGWDGMAAALLGGCEPILTVISSLVFGALRSGGMNMSTEAAVPSDFIYIVEGVLVIFIATPYFIYHIYKKVRKE